MKKISQFLKISDIKVAIASSNHIVSNIPKIHPKMEKRKKRDTQSDNDYEEKIPYIQTFRFAKVSKVPRRYQ